MSQIASDPADALQVGIYELLTDDETLEDLASIYDGPPEDVEPPYVAIGEMMSTEDSVHGSQGRQTSAVLHTWTRGESHRLGNQIGDLVVGLLTRREEDLDPLVDGHTVWRIEHEFAQTLIDPQPSIRHRVDRFRIWTRQEDT